MVPQGAEPLFHVCRRQRFEDLSELQSAGAPRTPQALGPHLCTRAVGALPARARTPAAATLLE